MFADPDLQRALLAAGAGDDPLVDVEIARTLPGHGLRTLRLNARSIVREGHPSLLLLAIDDVTDDRESQALRIETETLRRVNRRKDEFLGVLAHELRNPLAPMRFALEVLRRSERIPPSRSRPGRCSTARSTTWCGSSMTCSMSRVSRKAK